MAVSTACPSRLVAQQWVPLWGAIPYRLDGVPNCHVVLSKLSPVSSSKAVSSKVAHPDRPFSRESCQGASRGRRVRRRNERPARRAVTALPASSWLTGRK